jgi:hypothetical protein
MCWMARRVQRCWPDVAVAAEGSGEPGRPAAPVGRTPASILAPDAVRLAAGEIPESQVLESQFTMTAEQEYRGITVTLWVRR